MAVVAVFGAKGGVGASLVATNLALALHGLGGALLVDLHGAGGSADLLLDLAPERSWADLLPVVGELSERHLELTCTVHAQGLRLLAAPAEIPEGITTETVSQMVGAAARHFAWTVVDLELRCATVTMSGLNPSDSLMMVLTPDPPALRAARRWLAGLPDGLRQQTGLVINQYDAHHPATPEAIESSLSCELRGVLPREPVLVGEQVNFGRPVLEARGARFSAEIYRLTERVVSSAMPPI